MGRPASSVELPHAAGDAPTRKPAATELRTASLFSWIFTSNFLYFSVIPWAGLVA
jgi:hypothetical protein